MAFAFNFTDEDVDPDPDLGSDSISADVQPASVTAQASVPQMVPVVEHSLQEWLQLLPSQLSYSVVTIESPGGKRLSVPRRELFDVRQQLMAEDSESTIRDLETSDLRTNVYEGGFKTWECSLDLASILLDRGPRKDIDELARVAYVTELGAGTALPSLVLFQHALQNSYPVNFTLADFNADVLRLVTVPNLVLTYAWYFEDDLAKDAPNGDLDITPALIESFLRVLKDRRIGVQLLSGPWGPDLAKLLPDTIPDMTNLVLAAETIYSPQSLSSFVDLLAHLLKRGHTHKAMVAAKKFYFGVGGSTDALKVACGELGLVASEMLGSGLPGLEGGVGRAIIEIQTT